MAKLTGAISACRASGATIATRWVSPHGALVAQLQPVPTAAAVAYLCCLLAFAATAFPHRVPAAVEWPLLAVLGAGAVLQLHGLARGRCGGSLLHALALVASCVAGVVLCGT